MHPENKITQQMAPMLRRVLLVDPNVAASRLISEIMRDAFRSQIWTAPNHERAIKLANSINPEIIFTEYQATGLDGLAFVRDVRNSRFACRKAPIVMVTGQATEASIMGARDAGVHEFLRKPFSMKELMRRLEAVTLRQRDWVEGMKYIGPDRRRFNSGDYTGPRKRQADGPQVSSEERITQALRILQAAVSGALASPEQAIRAMLAQTEDLQKVATLIGDSSLAFEARELHGYLDMIAFKDGEVALSALEGHAAALLRRLPVEEGPLSFEAA